MAQIRPSAPLAIALAALPAFLLAACSPRSDFPSLSPRPIESTADAPPAAPPATATTDPDLDARAAALLKEAKDGDVAFSKTANASCPAIARGLAATEGSETWILAQQSLSAIGAARGRTTSAAASLDQLAIESSVSMPGTDLTRLLEAAKQVSALDAAQQARVAAIRAGTCG